MRETGSLIAAFAVIFGCSRVTSWSKTDVRDTQHLVRPCYFYPNFEKLLVCYYAVNVVYCLQSARLLLLCCGCHILPLVAELPIISKLL